MQQNREVSLYTADINVDNDQMWKVKDTYSSEVYLLIISLGKRCAF